MSLHLPSYICIEELQIVFIFQWALNNEIMFK